MELKTWIRLESGRGAKLLAHLNSVAVTIDPNKRIVHAQITGWIADPGEKSWRPIPSYLAPAIEDFTRTLSGGDASQVVMRWDCCPKDWFVTWPELVKYPGRPLLPEEEAARASG